MLIFYPIYQPPTMNGSKSNKFMSKQSGQTLLIAIMLLATALTIVLSVTFTSRTETQLTKLEEEHQKALAAAEAAIEAALKAGGSVNIAAGGDLENLYNAGFSGGATMETTADKTTFVSPLLQADEQYTFYLSNYPNLDSSYSHPLTFYFASESLGSCDTRDKPALELTLFYDSAGISTIKKWIIEPCDSGKKIAGSGTTSATEQVHQMGDVNFNYSSSIDFSSYTNKFLLVRPLFAATRIGFDSGSPDTLPSQGKIITSTATSTTGASTVVQLFQSYPQIPAEFFVTSF